MFSRKILEEFRKPPKEGLIVNDIDGTPTGILVLPYAMGGNSIQIRKSIPDLIVSLFYTVSLNDDPDIADIFSVPQLQFLEADETVIGSPKLFGIPRENLLANNGVGYPSGFQSYIQIYQSENLCILATFINQFEAQLNQLIINNKKE